MKADRSSNPSGLGETDAAIIQEAVLAHVESRWESLTPHALEKFIATTHHFSRAEAKQLLKSLVMDGSLTYRDRYGRTVIEKSFDRAVRVSPRIVLKPPEAAFIPEEGDVVIQLRHGASFGTGSHPTTRMALQGIEEALKWVDLNRTGGTCALDIGTGSGVLGIAAVALGIHRALGLDIDACAVSEARENARLNGIQDRFIIKDASIGSLYEEVDLILANLRMPTLIRIFPDLQRLARRSCEAVISGIKADEMSDLKQIFGDHDWTPVWEKREKDWAGVVFHR